MLKNLLVILAALSMSAVANAGWTKGLSLGAAANVQSTDNNPSAQDGESVFLSGNLTGNLDYAAGNHAWKNTLKINESISKNAAFDEFVKGADELILSTEYNHELPSISWLKFYAEAEAKTNLFKTLVKTAAPVAYTGTQTATTDAFESTEAFGILTLAESIGVLAQFIKTDSRHLHGKAGVFAKQTMAEGAFDVVVDGATGTVSDRFDSDSYGVKLGLYFNEKLSETAKIYASVETYTPLSYSTDDAALEAADKSEIDLTDVIINAGLESKLNEFLTLRYAYKAEQLPFINGSNFQVDHGFFLTASYTMF